MYFKWAKCEIFHINIFDCSLRIYLEEFFGIDFGAFFLLKAILDTIDPAYGKVLIKMSFVLLDGFFEQKGRLFAT